MSADGLPRRAGLPRSPARAGPRCRCRSSIVPLMMLTLASRGSSHRSACSSATCSRSCRWPSPGLMFLSPLFYPVSAVPPLLRSTIYLNPLTFIVESARNALFLGTVARPAGAGRLLRGSPARHVVRLGVVREDQKGLRRCPLSTPSACGSSARATRSTAARRSAQAVRLARPAPLLSRVLGAARRQLRRGARRDRGIIGRNGSGKSTLLQLIVRHADADDGSVWTTRARRRAAGARCRVQSRVHRARERLPLRRRARPDRGGDAATASIASSPSPTSAPSSTCR